MGFRPIISKNRRLEKAQNGGQGSPVNGCTGGTGLPGALRQAGKTPIDINRVFSYNKSTLICNQGYGQKIAKAARGISHQLYPGKPIYLEVRTWNTRAVKCYEKVGFHITGEPIRQTTPIGEGTFYRMVAD